MYYAALVALLASFLIPASPANAGCVGGSCGSGVSLTPDSGKVGTMVVLSIASSAFPLEGDYEIRWSPMVTFEKDRTIVLKEGSVARGTTAVTASFTIPEAKYGAHYIQFMQLANRRVVNFRFTVKPSLKISPSAGTPGTTVTISGTGFPAQGMGKVTFDGKSTDVAIATNDVGSFTSEFIIPDTSAGEHELIATTEYVAVTATAELEVVPSASLPPEASDVDTEDTNTEVRDDNRSTPNLAQDSKAPPTPGVIAPMGHRFGLLGTQAVSFSWSKVSDPSGITYTLEIADNYEFLPLETSIQKTELAETSCTVSIEPGTYYWRVKAVDGADNESRWAYAPYTFKVAEVSALIQKSVELLNKVRFLSILGFIIGGLIILRILVLVTRAAIRRRRDYWY
ncbi:MAG: IPT/TIG domain-containing protein [Dehalococcoidia bacterium]|nr:IPT/TIG domain-containing protein [Dehalococcoidia bacterium]